MEVLRYASVVVLPLSLLTACGCEDSSQSQVQFPEDHAHEHGHDHSHDSLSDAVEELTTLRNQIRDAFGKNDPDAAHDPLHEVGHILEAIPDLAKKEGLAEEKRKIIETATETLMTAFGAVDKTMHGQEGSSYSEESARIDESLAALTQAAGVTPPADTASSEKPAEGTPAPAESTAPPADSSAPPAESAAPAAEAAPESASEN